MVKSFSVKTLFSNEDLSFLSDNFGLRRWSDDELSSSMQAAFNDYILASLAELGEGEEENKRIYAEANFHVQKASKQLWGMPHPVGKMAVRLKKMSETLGKLIDGSIDFSAQLSAERATRFMEKNLVRRLRDVWTNNTSTGFYAGGDGSGKNPRDFILFCFAAAGKQYPELSWFNQVDERIADSLIKSIKR
jgi:hypothetical protein